VLRDAKVAKPKPRPVPMPVVVVAAPVDHKRVRDDEEDVGAVADDEQSESSVAKRAHVDPPTTPPYQVEDDNSDVEPMDQ
jgi:hypothetical protein